jgi:hypothetical protein
MDDDDSDSDDEGMESSGDDRFSGMSKKQRRKMLAKERSQRDR